MPNRSEGRRASRKPTSVPRVSLPKTATGIRGFDEITYGGLPLGRTTLIRGSAGSGKTVFAVQSLVNGARDRKEPGLLVAFEEQADQIVVNAATLGWDIPALAAKRLFFLDASLSPTVVKGEDFDLSGLLNLLMAAAAEVGAKRVVLDGIDVLLRLLDNPVAERREMYRIRDWLSRSKLTAIITQKVVADDPLSRHHSSFMQFMADCVINLDHQVVDGSAYRNIRVVKYRGSGFLSDEFPLTITDAGIHVTNRGPGELKYVVTRQRISSGLPRLDAMLGGGYYRGSNILISGAHGTAKTTLAAAFTVAACQRGEPAMFVSFDESASQLVRDMASVGIRLEPHLKSGLLAIYSTRTRGQNIEEQFATLRGLVAAHKPKCVAVDPLSAIATQHVHLATAKATQAFLDYLKATGVTVVNTSLLDGLDQEATPTGISTMADTWIHVAYVVHEGERNRSLSIVKSRGSPHSNQVRELILSDRGLEVADVFTAGGEVLMGVARWEREQEVLTADRREQVALDVARRKLELAQTDAAARMKVVAQEIEALKAEIKLLDTESTATSTRRAGGVEAIRTMRHADVNGNGNGKGKRLPRKPARKAVGRRYSRRGSTGKTR